MTELKIEFKSSNTTLIDITGGHLVEEGEERDSFLHWWGKGVAYGEEGGELRGQLGDGGVEQ